MERTETSQTIAGMEKDLSSEFNYGLKEVAIILAAGHGKRIKSQRSKMLHKIWEVPTVERVYEACAQGIKGLNTIVVVGIMAKDVMRVLGKRANSVFALQEEQKGTGHAVQAALAKINPQRFDGIVYVLPGDMGLLNKETIEAFRAAFLESDADMMVLTGMYEGDPGQNSYGRIIRVKETDASGRPSRDDAGRVIKILEHKDILALPDDRPYAVTYRERVFEYSKRELIENREFNSGVYAFRFKELMSVIYELTSDNAQNEIYITDLIALFNAHGYTVDAVSPREQYVLMGFNNKSVLREMEKIAREKVYEMLKDIVEIDDPEDFFIDESVVDQIVELDGEGIPLDVRIGKGVHIGKGTQVNYNLTLKKNVFVQGNVRFGKNVTVGENVLLSCFPHQVFSIDDDVEILSGDIVKGNIEIGCKARIESSVNMTGSDEYPLRIGKNVLIKGTSYIFGSIIEDDVFIEHSVIIKKHVSRRLKRDGTIQPVRFYLPMPEGIDSVESLQGAGPSAEH